MYVYLAVVFFDSLNQQNCVVLMFKISRKWSNAIRFQVVLWPATVVFVLKGCAGSPSQQRARELIVFVLCKNCLSHPDSSLIEVVAQRFKDDLGVWYCHMFALS